MPRSRPGPVLRRTVPIVVVLAVAGLVLASPAGAAQTDPWKTFPGTGANAPGPNPYVVMVGDSLTVDANYSVQGAANYFRAETGRASYVSGTPGASWVTYGWPGQQNNNPLVYDLADFLNARITIGALATNDARLMTQHPGSYSQQQQYNMMQSAVAKTRLHSSCVMLVNVRARSVSGMSAANASKVNDNMAWLAATHPGGRVFVADWNAYSSSQPGWFKTNDVHLTATGTLKYFEFISNQAEALIAQRGC
jgi:hypothetical protein